MAIVISTTVVRSVAWHPPLYVFYAVFVPVLAPLFVPQQCCRLQSPLSSSLALVGRCALHSVRRSSAHMCVGSDCLAYGQWLASTSGLTAGFLLPCIHEFSWRFIHDHNYYCYCLPAVFIVNLTSELRAQLLEFCVSVDQCRCRNRFVCLGALN